MELGAFSVSLAVEDIEASKLFHEKLGLQLSRETNRRIGCAHLRLLATTSGGKCGPTL